MVLKFLGKKIILYPTVGIITFLISKHYFPTEAEKAEREKNKGKLPGGYPPGLDGSPSKKIDPLDHVIKDPQPPGLSTRGGSMPGGGGFWTKLLANDGKHIIASVSAVAIIAVGGRFKDVLGEIIRGASPIIVGLPVPLVRRLLERFDSLKPKQIYALLKEGLLSNELTIADKARLIKKSMVSLAISANTVRTRRALLTGAVLLISGAIMTSGPLVSAAIIAIQDLFTRKGCKRAITDFIVEIYREYNAPFPKEFYDLLESVTA